MRRGGEQPVLRYHPDIDPLLLWYVDGFAVLHDGREIGTVELVLPTVDGDLPGSLVVRAADGTSGLLDVSAVDALRFTERRVGTAVEPAPFDLTDSPAHIRYPASA